VAGLGPAIHAFSLLKDVGGRTKSGHGVIAIVAAYIPTLGAPSMSRIGRPTAIIN
jgi:hypothetical protein